MSRIWKAVPVVYAVSQCCKVPSMKPLRANSTRSSTPSPTVFHIVDAHHANCSIARAIMQAYIEIANRNLWRGKKSIPFQSASYGRTAIWHHKKATCPVSIGEGYSQLVAVLAPLYPAYFHAWVHGLLADYCAGQPSGAVMGLQWYGLQAPSSCHWKPALGPYNVQRGFTGQARIIPCSNTALEIPMPARSVHIHV